VTNDVAEDAFFKYLKRLEEIARLEIVSIYCESNALEPDLNTLHVIGRTSAKPHTYFYRRYAQGMWTPWETVGPSIEGDHIVAMVWQDRLNLFWLKFLDRVWQQPGTTQTIDPTTKNTFDTATPPLRTVQVQLKCTQYFQWQWSPPSSTAFQDPAFNGSPIFIIVQGMTSTAAASSFMARRVRRTQWRSPEFICGSRRCDTVGWICTGNGRRWTSASKS